MHSCWHDSVIGQTVAGVFRKRSTATCEEDQNLPGVVSKSTISLVDYSMFRRNVPYTDYNTGAEV